MPSGMANAFSGLSNEQVASLQGYLDIRVCEPGTEVVHLGTIGEDMYFVLDGEGKIHRNVAITLASWGSFRGNPGPRLSSLPAA